MTAPQAVEPSWMTNVRLRVARRAAWLRVLWDATRRFGEEGMSISHSEVERAAHEPGAQRAMERDFYRSDEMAGRLSAQIAEIEATPDTCWLGLVALCGLADVESELLALALAAELDPALRRAYGYLLDEAGPLEATTGLVAQLWQRPHPARIGPHSALVRWGVAWPAPGGTPGSSNCGWQADVAVLDELCGTDSFGLSAARGMDDRPNWVMFPDELDQAVSFFSADPDDNHGAVLEVVAPPGSGRTVFGSQVGAKLGARCTVIDSADPLVGGAPQQAIVREVRRAAGRNELIVWERAELLPAEGVRALVEHAPLSVLETEAPLSTTRDGRALWLTVALPALNRPQREGLWSARRDQPPPKPIRELNLSAREVTQAARVAGRGEDAVRDACRAGLARLPGDILERMPLPYTWDDLVLPAATLARLRDIEEFVHHRDQVWRDWGLRRLTPMGTGAAALFHGPSGTGKTMSAQVLARSLGLDLYRVDLAGTVNKYIGETEKQLRRIFDACEQAPVVLLFDEADALFGKRTAVKDAHDRYANIETSYLLQRMERFDGIAVLATNRRGDLDDAFVRRLRICVEFPPPDASARTHIWQAALHNGHGRLHTDDVDLEVLGAELDMTPAAIKSAALAAAFRAAATGKSRVGLTELWEAACNEQEKRGEILRPGRLLPEGG